MTYTIKQIIDKNKKAFDSGYFIESINLSYILINKALKQVVTDDFKEDIVNPKIKTNILIKHIREVLNHNDVLKTKISKCSLKDISQFISLYKSISKELKYQYPEKKIADTATLGINCVIVLNTSLIKIKNNRIN